MNAPSNGWMLADGSGPYPHHFDDCPHTDVEIERADPDVGLFGDAAWCNGCGAEAVDEDSDVVLDEEGNPQQVGTGAPIWGAPRYTDPTKLTNPTTP